MEQHGQSPHKDQYSRGHNPQGEHGHWSDEIKKQARPNNVRNEKRRRQKTTAVALGVLMVLSMGLIGFEVMNNNAQDSANPSVRGSKSLLILSQERERDGAGLLSSLGTSWEERGRSDVATNETLKLQANKIKALQRQLVEASQKLHEVKAHLFTKGDPSDRARLAELCQDLVEKERLTNEYQERLVYLEKERETDLQKMKRMEHTVDALAAMTDSQRETKEQAILSFQAQIEQLQNNARQEKDELKNMISELEQMRHQLKEEITDKLAVIKNLEHEISWQYGVIDDKDREIKDQSHLYAASEANLNRQLQDLAVAMELENIRNNNLKTELEISEARGSATHQYASTLEERAREAEERARQDHDSFVSTTLALIREYQDLQGLMDVYANAHDHYTNKEKKLAALAREEKNRADTMHQELDRALAKVDSGLQRQLCMEEELYNAADKITALNEDIRGHREQLNSKQRELEMLAYANASLKDQLHEKINQLTASLGEEIENVKERDAAIENLTISLELERTHSQELDHYLRDSVANNLQEQARVHTLEEELSKKAELLAALDNRLLDKQDEIAQMKMQLNYIGTNFEQEKLKTQELHHALVSSLGENENNQFLIRQLQSTLDDNTDSLALLQDRLADKKGTIEQMQDKIDEISLELDGEKRVNDDLQRTLATTSAEHESGVRRTSNLETEIQNHAKKIVSLEDALADKHHEINGLLDRVNKLNFDLELEASRSNDLARELEKALTMHMSEGQRAQHYEQTLGKSEEQIAGLLNQLDHMSAALEKENTRASDLEQNLLSALSKHDQQIAKNQDLERAILESNKKISQLQQTIADQQDAIEGFNSDIAKLSENVVLEKNRTIVLQEANKNESEKKGELEQHLQQYTTTVDELRRSVQEKDRNIRDLQARVNRLSEDLEREIAKSLEINERLKSGITENEQQLHRSQKMEKSLEYLQKELENKTKELEKATKNKTGSGQELERLKEEIDNLRKEKEALERKHSQQLTLLLHQQDLVNRLTNDLEMHKNVIAQWDRSGKEVAYDIPVPSEAASDEQTSESGTAAKGAELASSMAHLVRDGETLSSISVKYYGNPNRWVDIYNANKNIIADKNRLKPGTKLIIPK